MMGEHLVDGTFKSDKYGWSPPGFLPLKITDPMAQPFIWEYAQRRRVVDPEFSADLETALKAAGFVPPPALEGGEEELRALLEKATPLVPWLAVHGVLDPDEEGNARSFIKPVPNAGYQVAQTVGPNGEAHSELIVAMRNHLPALLSALAGMRSENERLKATIQRLVDVAVTEGRAALQTQERTNG